MKKTLKRMLKAELLLGLLLILAGIRCIVKEEFQLWGGVLAVGQTAVFVGFVIILFGVIALGFWLFKIRRKL